MLALKILDFKKIYKGNIF